MSSDRHDPDHPAGPLSIDVFQAGIQELETAFGYDLRPERVRPLFKIFQADGFTNLQFREAVEHCRRNCRYFPVYSDFHRAREEARGE